MESRIDPDQLAPARRFGAFLGWVVAAGSVSPPGRWRHSAVRCRRRPGHRRCAGRLHIREGIDCGIEWSCPACKDQGVVRGWYGSPYDLRELRERQDRPAIEIVVTEQEYDELKKCLTMDIGNAGILYGASYTREAIVLRAVADDLEYLVDHVASEINHEQNRKRRLDLERVLGRLESAMGSWCVN